MADKLRVSKHLLLSASSPETFEIVLTALRTILSDSGELLSDDFIAIVKDEFNARRRFDGENVQMNNNNNKVGAHGSDEDGLSNTMIEDLRYQLLEHLDKHHVSVSSNVRNGCSVAMCSNNNKSRIEVILIGEKRFDSHNPNTANKTCGIWSGIFSLKENKLRGHLSLSTHYFENCNFQLQSEQEFGPKTMSPETIALQQQDQTIAEAVVKQIYAWEQECIGSLDETFANMGNGTLKSLRRVMPITRQKMDWNIQPHRMIKILGITAADNVN
eukprot:CAMPEP_0116028974 /NCGR_PEP_ID=MMETSP0321-20121206/15810_1 /TAXON_ID=163516 /ORGANISM="Leptocylindrus danicus var. danicus, Strain B650" /LENGTH=271 /DNA_ID=CAMNT_0003503155 /DNA_START=1478 /DNA_END=2293 /DNA_ORIENTATION=-